MNNGAELVTFQYDGPETIIRMVLDGLTSDHSRRAYGRALADFMKWYLKNGKPGLNKATVQRYKSVLQEQKLSPSTINQRMSAIRKLAQEAADNKLLDQTIANGVSKVKGVKSQGTRVGNWLTRDDAQALLSAPDISFLKGLRDRAILAVLIGAGLRRSEVTILTLEHIQQRDGRWVIVDLVGKGNRVRTVPIPAWCKAAIDEWVSHANIQNGRIFRPIHKGGFVNGEHMTDQAVHDVVKEYAGFIGLKVAAHDLRRTFAKLAHKGGANLEQIQLSLGHASIQTTERYLGVQQDLGEAPCDRLGIKI